MSNAIHPTPWDKKALGIDTYEVREDSEEALKKTMNRPGHFTIKVDPLTSKKRLHDYEFYYCDTLLKPCVNKNQFHPFEDDAVSLSEIMTKDELMKMSNGAYHHGRFHRDFHIHKEDADLRYDNWLEQLYEEKNVWKLLYSGKTAGFFAFHENDILLQALKERFQGRGLAKYFWTTACQELFSRGYDELHTSISACNLAMLNLLSSLGFRFTEAVDVYHKKNTPRLSRSKRIGG